MDERNFENREINMHDNINTEPQSAAEIKHNGYEDISSVSPQYSAPKPQIQTNPGFDSRYVQQPQYAQPQQPGYSEYDSYLSSYNNQQSYRATSAGRSGKGKKIGLVIGALALSLCVGLGGGVLGATMMGNTAVTPKSSVTNSNSQKTTASTSDGADSGLTIVQSNEDKNEPTSIENVVKNVKDSVVEITTESTSYDAFYGQYVSQGAGSGVIISEDGYIVTNNHVIEDASTITVKTTNGKSYKAKLIGTDETFDVAMIKIEASGLTVAALGDSDKLNVGETAIAIGNPLGQLGGTVTTGIISATGREIKIDNTTMELLQTDAAINPGNSGGGLFDANGSLIGIVVAKSTSTSTGTSLEGLGFAIPINNVKSILGDLKENGRVTGRPSLGVSIVDVNTQSSMARFGVSEPGVYVAELTKGAAAEKAGIMVGDRIVKIGTTEIGSSSELKSALLKLKAGDKTDVVVSRDGKEVTISVTLDESNTESENSSTNNFNPNGNAGGYGGYDGYGGFSRGDDFTS